MSGTDLEPPVQNQPRPQMPQGRQSRMERYSGVSLRYSVIVDCRGYSCVNGTDDVIGYYQTEE